MSEQTGGSPIQAALVTMLLGAGGYYFYNNQDSVDLGNLSNAARSKFSNSTSIDDTFVSYRDAPVMIGPNQSLLANKNTPVDTSSRLTGLNHDYVPAPRVDTLAAKSAVTISSTEPRPSYRPVKIASWSLGGFGPTKLASADARKYVSKVIRRYDVIALQQIASIERDLIPRLVDVINGPEHRYDYVLGRSTGPTGRQEQLAFIFDTTSVRVDRRQTYTVSDPSEQMIYDPLVASFQAAEPNENEAWTFSLVNVRVDLSRAAAEVALLPNVLRSVLNDGRNEDDVILLGLFQADDDYLIPTMGSGEMDAAVHHRSTDVFGRFQTSNILIARGATSEYLGRGGVFDYRRNYDLNPVEAESVTSHLPVFADFTAHEGGEL
ncbi:deoxyribonuclease I [Rubripirellula amarantea]|nr:deoxyribonuclease I [Rubripirellula amarantea]